MRMSLQSETAKKRLPTNIAGMMAANQCLGTVEGLTMGMAFQPRSTDVIISPYSKSGTTWLQQMVHALRTRGSMDFREITEVVPWLEMAHDLELDLEASQKWPLRAYKSHLSWDEIPKGGKYIYCIRDPKDVVISFFHFFEGFMFEPGTITLREFAKQFFLKREGLRGNWAHVASWWRQRENPQVLILCFEEMKLDLAETVRRVANFIEIELDEELFDITVEHSSYAFMKAHEQHFDEYLSLAYLERHCGMPAGGSSSKVRTGKSQNHKKELPEDIGKEMDAIWEREIGAEFGLASYEAMRVELKY